MERKPETKLNLKRAAKKVPPVERRIFLATEEQNRFAKATCRRSAARGEIIMPTVTVGIQRDRGRFAGPTAPASIRVGIARPSEPGM